MNTPTRTINTAALWLAAAFNAQAAGTTLYTSEASFQAAAVSNLLATFEGIGSGSLGSSLTNQGITITPLAGAADVFIAPAGSVYFPVPNTSAVLTANGDENFRIARSDGAAFGSIGFDFYTNPYGAPSFFLWAAGGVLIDSYVVAQMPSTLGFIGFTSSTPIAYLTTRVDRGGVIDTGIDNLRLGEVSPVPEPKGWALWAAGLAGLGWWVRRRSAVR